MRMSSVFFQNFSRCRSALSLSRSQFNGLRSSTVPCHRETGKHANLTFNWTIGEPSSSLQWTRMFSSQDKLVDDLEQAAYRLLSVKLEQEDKVTLSAYFRQVTEGPCQEPEPVKRRNPEDLMYWQYWKKLGNMSKEEAAQKYLEMAKKFI